MLIKFMLNGDEEMRSNLILTVLAIPLAVAIGVLASNAEEKSGEAGKSYDNPFAYCEAVGTIDKPGADYTGPEVPESIAKGLKKAFGSPESAPLDVFMRGTYWRCMDGKVYACNVGANLPCYDKADMSKEPNQGMKEFCNENPGSDFIPMSATGHSTVYDWKCDGTTPVAGKQLMEVDKQGYQKDIWYEINPPE